MPRSSYYIKYILFLNCFLSLLTLKAQEKQEGIELSAVVLDAKTLDPVPFTTIHIVNKKRGTYCNAYGVFHIDKISLSDSIVLSFIGYQSLVLDPSVHFYSDTIFLEEESTNLNEVIILGKKDQLYSLIRKSKKTKSVKVKQAKAYFSLETSSKNQQVELLECYYNGQFSAYDIKKLDLKNGRIALANFDNRFFVSTETSSALNKYHTFDNNSFFPLSPFQLSKKKLLKLYDLQLISSYKDDQSNTIFVIDFEPRKESTDLFSGKVWIDSTSGKLFKLNLEISNTSVHPFTPIGHADSLTQVNLQISKTYEEIESIMYLQSMDFNYSLEYKDRRDSIYIAQTKAVLYAYNYDSLFTLPSFDFSDGSYGDYRKINATPYNNFFWENMDEFSSGDQRQRNNVFVQNESNITNQQLFGTNTYFKKGFLQHPYVFWDEKRIEFGNGAPDSLKRRATQGKTPSERYKLAVQIYMDVNVSNDSLHVLTQTVFDPFKSFFHFPKSPEGTAFINMYFDLMEIQRLALEEEIRYSKLNESEVRSLYRKKLSEIEILSESFFKETQHGSNPQAMVEWNDYIVEKLGIDNLELFQLYQSTEVSMK